MSRADTMAHFNRGVTNPIALRISGRIPPWVTVTHRGRRSGRTYTTPVVAFGTADGLVVPLPYGTDRDWVRNVEAAGGCRIERAGRTRDMTRPEVIDAAHARPLLPAVVRSTLGRAVGHFLVLRSA